MNKILSLVFLIGGVILIIAGLNASDSLGSDISRFFTGSPTNRSIWLLIGGTVAAIVGAAGLLRGTKTV